MEQENMVVDLVYSIQLCTMNMTLLEEIQTCKFTHILLSPELAVSRKLRPVLLSRTSRLVSRG